MMAASSGTATIAMYAMVWDTPPPSASTGGVYRWGARGATSQSLPRGVFVDVSRRGGGRSAEEVDRVRQLESALGEAAREVDRSAASGSGTVAQRRGRVTPAGDAFDAPPAAARAPRACR